MTDFAARRTALAVIVAIVLLLLVAILRNETTTPSEPKVAALSESRIIEPRLTSATFWAPCKRFLEKGRVVEQSDCGPPYLSRRRASLRSNEACEKVMTDHGETLRLLIKEPVCINAAIDWLGEEADRTRSPRILSDLGAALFIRAQEEDRPSDLLRSHDAARRAVEANPHLPEGWFNLALAQEALGFPEKARLAWARAAQLDQTAWADEAKTRITALEKAADRSLALRWSTNQPRLPQAAADGDRRSVAVFVRPYPAAAQKYLEEEVLHDWASAAAGSADAAKRLHEAAVIADELEDATEDPYLRDVVAAIRKAKPAELRSLRRAHLLLAEARTADRAFNLKIAEPAYAEAAERFARAGSPLRFGAEIGRAIQISWRSDDKSEAKQKLAAVAAESRQAGYLNVFGRAKGNIANILQTEGQYLEAIALYDEILPVYGQMNDDENVANAHMRKAGIFRVLGQEDAALREAFLAQRRIGKVVEMRSRHLLAGETAATALALDLPEIAFDYQTTLIEALERERDNATSQAAKDALLVNRAIALRARAAIRLRLNDREGAQKEINEAVEISAGMVSEKTQNALRARIAEADGDAALPGDPKRAIKAFTDALNLSGTVRYRTFHAILLARRAAAYRLDGQPVEAEKDLVTAIAELNKEETELLAGTPRGQGEALWTGYFSRFQETYDRLIGLLLADRRKEDAFAYAEKSRAFEPLSLVLELPVAQNTLRRIDPKAIAPDSLESIQAALPVGTFVLEYQVTDEQTHVWVVSRDDIEVRTLRVKRKDIKSWIRTIQREAVTEDAPRFDAALAGPSMALFAEPLQLIATLKNGRLPNRRLVIVPDRYMHGLPFATLKNPVGNYLVEDFTIATAASATLYVHSLRRDQKLAARGGTPTALLVGNPAFDKQLEVARDLKPLRFAEIEARAAGALYAPHATVLVQEQATVPAFLASAKDSVIVHVAGHAIVNRHPPFGTLLLLAPVNGHDGLLYTDELLKKLELDRARLVVLAACSSAGGVPVGPEGLAPLVRPIVAAGVPGIVGSLWTIDDQRSQKVLSEFHRHYRDGHDAARALQLAQIRFLREKKIPVLAVAPFQVVGHASSPFPLNYQPSQ
ncbi:MAG TPA: CHAT domain-containing protein [Thermoanaerobaculia bacterium]